MDFFRQQWLSSSLVLCYDIAMKVLGITAEYNPFHNGHKYHIEKSRELTGADCVVAVMSGNFTQRGEAAILDKWERSRLAVENGVDLVVELPFVFACSRAQSFAEGAVDILRGLGAQIISFGSESGEIDELYGLAEALVKKSEEIASAREVFMQKGTSFAKAGELAAAEVLGEEAVKLMVDPNNILALEYLKRMIFWKEKGHVIEPFTVKRHGSGYFEENSEMGFAGASAIRRMKTREEFGKYVPENVAEALCGSEAGIAENSAECTLQANECALRGQERLFHLVRSEIVKSSPEALARIYHMGEGLENKLKKEIVAAKDLDELVSSVVSKRYTEAAVRRLLTYVLMGIREYEPSKAVYGRVLAANETGRKLIGSLKKQEEYMPIITNINKDELNNEEVQACLKYDVLAADMYNLIYDRDMYAFSDKVRRPYMAGID